MQSAIVEAFKSILPADSSAGAAPPAAASASASASAQCSASAVEATPTVDPAVSMTQPLQGQTERAPRLAQGIVLLHKGPVSAGATAEQSRSSPHGLSGSLPPARPQHAPAPDASSMPAASLPHSPLGQFPITVASPTASLGDHAQVLPDQVPIAPMPGHPASQQQPQDPPPDLPPGAKPLQLLPAVSTSEAVGFSSTEATKEQAVIPTGSKPGMPPAPPTAAEAAKATANADRPNTTTAAVPAPTPTIAAAPSAAAEPVAAAAASSQALSGAVGSSQHITASTNIPTNIPMPSKAVMPQLAPVAATLTAAANPLPVSLGQALPVPGSAEPQSTIFPASAASLTPGVAFPGPQAPTQPLRTPVAACVPFSKGSSPPPENEAKRPGKASGTAPQPQGSISATAVTPSATAHLPPATAVTLPATAATPSAAAANPTAAAAILPATAATPPAPALTASAPAASQSKSDKPLVGPGTAEQGSVRGPPGAAKEDSAAPGGEPLHSTAPSTVMVTQSLAALTPPVALNPLRGQPAQLPAKLTAALETRTVADLLPPDLSPGAPTVGAPVSSWLSREASKVPQLPVDLAPSATARAVPGTAATVGVSLDLSPSLPRTQLVAPPIPSAAAAERPFQFPANPALSPAPASITPTASQGFAGIPVSPSLFSPAQAAGPIKKKSSKASKKRKAEEQAVPSSAKPKIGAKQPPASADKKRKAERQAIPSSIPPQSGAKQSPAAAATTAAAAALSGLPSGTPDSAARQPPNALSPNHKRRQSAPNKDSFEFVSPELTAMRNAHGSCPIPMVGADTVQSHLADVKSLVTDSMHKYSLKDIISAIGEFAVGRKLQQEIFLGDLHNSQFHQQQVGLHFFFLFSSSFCCRFFSFFCC